jgi:hypothetical protein
VLDVVMDEDGSRARKDHAPENLARLRRFALNLLRANPTRAPPAARSGAPAGMTPSSSRSSPPNAIALRFLPPALAKPGKMWLTATQQRPVSSGAGREGSCMKGASR